MGAATSSIPAEPLVAAAAVAGALGYGYLRYADKATDSDTVVPAPAALHGQKKRGRKLQLPGDATLKNLDALDAPPPAPAQPPPPPPRARVVAFPEVVIPGGLDAPVSDDAQPAPSVPAPTARAKKPKKKAGKRAGGETSDASASAAPTPVGKAPRAKKAPAAEAEGERWTRVEARKRKPDAGAEAGAGAPRVQMDVVTSDAGITTSATGNSSPVTERTTEDELPSGLDGSALGASASAASLSDALRVVPVRPPPGEQPAKGFTWDDYEGVQVDEDASGEDDGGWGVVRSRRRATKADAGAGGASTAGAPPPLTKKQRQNAQKHAALKEAKREREQEQQAAFAAHKRELEHARMAEQAAAAPKRTGSRFDSLG